MTEHARPLRGLSDRYQVAPEPLAIGGMGVIWTAQDHDVGRWIAVKSLGTEFVKDRRAYERLARETRILAELSHPGICHLYDRYLLEDPPCYTMELVQGRTMSVAIRDLHRESPVDAEVQRQLLGCVVNIANTIGFAHERGIVHRDLKPDNVLLGRFGEVFVMDWGIATHVGSRQEELSGGPLPNDPRLSVDGQVIGTPLYLSPEQAIGGVVDERTDVFGLGALLFEVIVGSAPKWDDPRCAGFGDASVGPAAADLHAACPHLDLEAVVWKALAHEPCRRYATARAFREDLERFFHGLPVTARSHSPAERLGLWVRRNRRILLPVAGVAVVSIVVFVVGLLRHLDSLRVAQEEVSSSLAVSERSRGALLAQGGKPLEAIETFRAARARELALDLSTTPTDLYYADAERRAVGPVLSWAPVLGDAGEQPQTFLIAPDCSRLYFANRSSGILVYDALTGAETLRIETDGPIQALGVTANGRVLIGTRRGQQEVWAWDTVTGERMWTLDCGEAISRPNIEVAQSASTLVLAIGEQRILVWPDPAHPDERIDIEVRKRVANLALSSDGTLIAVGVGNVGVDTFEAATGKRRWTFNGERQGAFDVVFSPDDSVVLAVGTGRELLRLASSNGEVLTRVVDSPHQFHFVANYPGGDLFAVACSEEGLVQLVNSETLELVRSLWSGGEYIQAIWCGPDGRIAQVHKGGHWDIWGAGSMKSNDQLAVHSVVSGFDAALGGELLITTGGGAGVQVWDVDSGKRLCSLDSERVGDAHIRVASDGIRFLVTMPDLGLVEEWNLGDLFARNVIHRAIGESGARGSLLPSSYGLDGQSVLVSDNAGDLRVLRRPGGQPDLVIDGTVAGVSGKSIWSVAFGPRGQTLVAAAHENPEVRVWDASTGERLRDTGTEWIGQGYELSFSPSGDVFYLGEWENGVRRGSYETLNSRNRRVHAGPVMDLVVSGDGDWVFTGSWDGSCLLLDAETLDPAWEFKGPGPVIYEVDQEPGGAFLARDGEGRLYRFDPGAVDRRAELRERAEHAQIRLRLDSTDTTAFANLTAWCAYLEEWEMALRFLELDLAAGGDPNPVLMGKVYWLVGDPTNAREAYAAALTQGLVSELRGRLILEALDREIEDQGR